jgi:hypothetical protein
LFGIDSRHIRNTPLSRRRIELLADQPLVKKPDTAGIAACGRGADNGFDVGRADGEEKALEECEIDPFVLESEGQMAFERRRRCVTGVYRRQPVSSMIRWRVPMADNVLGTGTASLKASMSAA